MQSKCILSARHSLSRSLACSYPLPLPGHSLQHLPQSLLCPTHHVMSQDIQARAACWLKDHPEGVTASLVADQSALESLPGHLGSNLHFKDSTEAGWSFNLGFSPAISAASSLSDAQAAFNWIALDKVPLPGFEKADSWAVYPQVPVSSFKEGVTITAYTGSRIKLHVKSSFFAVYGRRTDVVVPCGAPSPEGTYFQIRQSIPMDLQLDVPITWSAVA